jgi:hypothetical protein
LASADLRQFPCFDEHDHAYPVHCGFEKSIAFVQDYWDHRQLSALFGIDLFDDALVDGHDRLAGVGRQVVLF